MRQLDLIELAQAADADDFLARLIRLAGELDFGRVSAVVRLADQHGRRLLSRGAVNPPASILAQAMDPVLGARDPVFQQQLRVATPFCHDQAFYVGAGAADQWDFAASHGYRVGVNTALSLAPNKRFLMSFDRAEALPGEPGQLRLQADLQLIALYASTAADRIFRLEDEWHRRQPPQKLTAKETEVVNWIVGGKTNWEIGQILNISENTVKFHLKNICSKLGAVNRIDAAMKAMAGGLK